MNHNLSFGIRLVSRNTSASRPAFWYCHLCQVIIIPIRSVSRPASDISPPSRGPDRGPQLSNPVSEALVDRIPIVLMLHCGLDKGKYCGPTLDTIEQMAPVLSEIA